MKTAISLFIVLSLAISIMGCSASDPLTEDIYYRGNVYTWNGTAYQLVNTNLGGGTGNTTTIWGAITGTLSNQTDLQSALDGKQATLGYTPADNVTAQSHYSNTSNPHSVTKTQVGLSNVTNVAQADNVTAVAHYNNTSNPHSTTAAQVAALSGLSIVTTIWVWLPPIHWQVLWQARGRLRLRSMVLANVQAIPVWKK